MGMTPLEGLIMGTRCGDIDPAIIPYIMDENGNERQRDRLCHEQEIRCSGNYGKSLLTEGTYTSGYLEGG